jgi:hypothetical protein
LGGIARPEGGLLENVMDIAIADNGPTGDDGAGGQEFKGGFAWILKIPIDNEVWRAQGYSGMEGTKHSQEQRAAVKKSKRHNHSAIHHIAAGSIQSLEYAPDLGGTWLGVLPNLSEKRIVQRRRCVTNK